MNKVEFLNVLELSFKDFKEDDRKEILYDYEEHFRMGEENGKTEEELIEELGDPRNIANQYNGNVSLFEIKQTKSDNTESDNTATEKRPMLISVIVACALVMFNLIFLVGPFFGIIGVVIGLIGAALGLTLGGVAMIFGVVLEPIFPHYFNGMSGFSSVAITFLGIGTTALGLLFAIGTSYLTQFIYRGVAKYIKWNIKIIKS